MDLYKKILIAIIIIIFTYVIWRFIVRRQQLLKQMEKFQTMEGFIEGADPFAMELEKIHSSKLINIQNVAPRYVNLPLIEFCIKGSYNSAFTGTFINVDMIKYLASRGCRFYDFEVYYIENKSKYTPQVGVCTDPKLKVMTSENTVLLDNVLSAVVANSFSQVSPNNKDPVFINLRIKLTDYKNAAAYHAIASSVDYALSNKLYKGKVTNKTPLQEIMGQVVLMVDKTEFYDYAQYTKCDDNTKCYDLTKYTNMESGSETLHIMRYKDLTDQNALSIMIKDDNLHTNISNMSLVYPDSIPPTRTNPVIYDYIKKHGCQIVPFRFYLNDKRLENYEEFFNMNSAALVPLTSAIQYYAKNDA